jgi:integrase
MAFSLRKYKGGPEIEIYISVLLSSGERIIERVKSPREGKAASKRWAEERETFLILNSGAKKAPDPEPVKIVTVDELIPVWEARYRAARRKPGTVTNNVGAMQRHVKRLFGSCDVVTMGKIEVESTKEKMADNGPCIINLVMALILQILDLAKAQGLRGHLPEIEYLPYIAPEVEPYEPYEYEALLKASPLDTHSQHRVICLLGGDAGLRCSEIAALHRVDVDLVNGFLHVKNNLSDNKLTTPKTRKSKRRIELTQRLKEALKTQLLSHAAPTVCIWTKGQRMTRFQVSREVRHVEKRAGLVPKEATVFAKVHKLRHTFGTRLARNGATTKEIAELMGHSTTRSTEVYLHLAKVDRGRAIKLLDGEIVETAR